MPERPPIAPGRCDFRTVKRIRLLLPADRVRLRHPGGQLTSAGMAIELGQGTGARRIPMHGALFFGFLVPGVIAGLIGIYAEKWQPVRPQRAVIYAAISIAVLGLCSGAALIILDLAG